MKMLPVATVFGKGLVMTGDLDPVYVAFVRAADEEPKLFDSKTQMRWLFAYWCFYHMGTAAYIAQFSGRHFWTAMSMACSDAPRSRERRHFRGRAAFDAIDWYAAHVEDPVRWFETCLRPCTTFDELSAELQKLPLFGPWIAFKAADMIERCLGWPVEFDNGIWSMYHEPVAGARLVQHGRVSNSSAPVDIEAVVYALRKKLARTLAPPLNDRPIGLQEIETILCKFKGFIHRRYSIGTDIYEIRKALRNTSCRLGKALREALPPEVPLLPWQD